MAVRFVPIEHQNEWIPVLQFPVGLKKLVRLCADRVSWRSTFLHWDSELGKTVPCHSPDECPLCPMPTRQTVYVPALELVPASRAWLRRIMPITEFCRSVLDGELEFVTFECVRIGRSKSPIRMMRTQLPYDAPACLPFSIERSLYRMWGCQNTLAESEFVR